MAKRETDFSSLPEPKSTPVSVRLTPEDKALYLQAAALDGKKSLSTWLKSLAKQRVSELKLTADGSTPEQADSDKQK